VEYVYKAFKVPVFNMLSLLCSFTETLCDACDMVHQDLKLQK
jgi:hypothetical protein